MMDKFQIISYLIEFFAIGIVFITIMIKISKFLFFRGSNPLKPKRKGENKKIACNNTDDHGNNTDGPCSSEFCDRGTPSNASKFTAKQVYEAMKKEDLSIVDFKFKEDYPNLSFEETKDEALKYFAIMATSRKSIAPSKAVDMYWHTMILCTRQYAKWCEKYASGFIHHNPTDGSNESRKENLNSFNNTMNEYSKCFGTPPESIWGKTNNGCQGQTQCGGDWDPSSKCSSESESDSDKGSDSDSGSESKEGSKMACCRGDANCHN